MSAIVYGKPKLGKEYGSKERVWHFYREATMDEFSWHVRACDDLCARMVYHSKGKSVRVCAKCLKEAAK